MALDYNAPMLTLAAMYALNNSSDPFFTSLEVGGNLKVKPKGQPCDPAFTNDCTGPQLSKAGKIAMSVVIIVVGLMIVGLLAWYIRVLTGAKTAE